MTYNMGRSTSITLLLLHLLLKLVITTGGFGTFSSSSLSLSMHAGYP